MSSKDKVILSRFYKDFIKIQSDLQIGKEGKIRFISSATKIVTELKMEKDTYFPEKIKGEGREKM